MHPLLYSFVWNALLTHKEEPGSCHNRYVGQGRRPRRRDGTKINHNTKIHHIETLRQDQSVITSLADTREEATLTSIHLLVDTDDLVHTIKATNVPDQNGGITGVERLTPTTTTWIL